MQHMVFAYGSLIATPEYSESVVDKTPAVLKGYRREFNKRSPGRGCPRSQAYAVFDDVPEGYLTDSWAFSLAVGTVPSAQDVIYGVALAYEPSNWAEVIRAMDRREGYDPRGERATLGYLRTEVRLSMDCTEVMATTYLSNPGGVFDLPESTSLDVRARILINGTPRAGSPLSRDLKVRGIEYLEQLRQQLRFVGHIDALLEAQAEAVLAYDGPWVSLITAPSISL